MAVVISSETPCKRGGQVRCLERGKQGGRGERKRGEKEKGGREEKKRRGRRGERKKGGREKKEKEKGIGRQGCRL